MQAHKNLLAERFEQVSNSMYMLNLDDEIERTN